MSNNRLAVCIELGGIRISQFKNFNFNSMCKFGDIYLGANEDGLFVLDSSDKDVASDIDAHVKLAVTDFGVSNQKRVRKLFVGYRTDGVLRFTVTGDERREAIVDLDSAAGSLAIHNQKVPIGRDVKGKYLGLKIENIKGSDFTVDNVHMVPIVLGTKPQEGV